MVFQAHYFFFFFYLFIFFTKNILKFPYILYDKCRFKIHDSRPKLATWHLILA